MLATGCSVHVDSDVHCLSEKPKCLVFLRLWIYCVLLLFFFWNIPLVKGKNTDIRIPSCPIHFVVVTYNVLTTRDNKPAECMSNVHNLPVSETRS